MLVEFPKGKTLLDLVGLQQELEDRMGIKFDISTYNYINHLIKDEILKDQVIILKYNDA